MPILNVPTVLPQPSLMPDHSALTQSLAEKAFAMIGRTEFQVSAILSVDRPESLENFGTFESMLLMAYQQGLNAGPTRPTKQASEVLG